MLRKLMIVLAFGVTLAAPTVADARGGFHGERLSRAGDMEGGDMEGGVEDGLWGWVVTAVL